jgi:hypothetical protein
MVVGAPGAAHVGPTRRIDGEVVDLRERPVVGATLRWSPIHPAQVADAKVVTARSDHDGRFVLEVPHFGKGRLDAVGPDGALAAVALPAGRLPVEDVRVVLEEGGILVVHAGHPALARGRVIVAAAEGEPLVSARHHAHERALARFEDPAELLALVDRVEDGLREWRGDDSRELLVGLMSDMLGDMPEVEEALREASSDEIDGAGLHDTRAFVDAVVGRLLAEEPRVADLVAGLAKDLQADDTLSLEDLVGHGGIERRVAELEATDAGGVVAPAEAVGVAEVPVEAVEPVEPVDPAAEDAKGLMATHGEDIPLQFIASAGRSLAEALPGADIPLRGEFTYAVAIDIGSPSWRIDCGRVRVPSGQVVVVRCGGNGDAVLEGELVDEDGAVVAGARVSLTDQAWYDRGPAVVSDAAGRFRLVVPTRLADTVGIVAWAERAQGDVDGRLRSITLRPDDVVDVGVIVLRSGAQAAELGVTERTAHLGGLALVEDTDGIGVADVEAGGPLAAVLGLTAGDRLLRAGGVDLTAVSLHEAMALLRPDAAGLRGVDGELVVRDAEGQVFTVPVEALLAGQ